MRADKAFDPQKAVSDGEFSKLKAMAEKGNADAQARLGFLYYTGNGVPKDYVKAAEWCRKAAEKGDANAQHLLGMMYGDGDGVEKDYTKARGWFLKAAEQGDAVSQSRLAVYCELGVGLPKDSLQAVKWYRKAAEQGDLISQVRLGHMYKNGDGVPEDYAEAAVWYRKAAEQGDAEDQFMFGYRCQSGDGAPKDNAEAVKWYRKAAEQGHAKAQRDVGLMYFTGGVGVIKNYVEAYRWLLLGSAQESGWLSDVSSIHSKNVTLKTIEIIESRITALQRAEGQRLALEFKPRASHPSSTASPEAVSENARPEVSGTGFFITDDGYFITNQHVAGSGATVRLVTASGLIAAKVVKVDKANDLSLLKANGVFSALPVITSSPVRLGAAAFTVGFPNVELQGFSPKLAKGEIAGLAGIQDDARHFQISAPIQPGNSGGALVDERGNVIGVVVARLSQKAALATSGVLAENVNYAVKSSYILSFLESVPEVAAKLKAPNTRARKFEDVVTAAEQAAVMVLVY